MDCTGSADQPPIREGRERCTAKKAEDRKREPKPKIAAGDQHSTLATRYGRLITPLAPPPHLGDRAKPQSTDSPRLRSVACCACNGKVAMRDVRRRACSQGATERTDAPDIWRATVYGTFQAAGGPARCDPSAHKIDPHGWWANALKTACSPASPPMGPARPCFYARCVCAEGTPQRDTTRHRPRGRSRSRGKGRAVAMSYPAPRTLHGRSALLLFP